MGACYCNRNDRANLVLRQLDFVIVLPKTLDDFGIFAIFLAQLRNAPVGAGAVFPEVLKDELATKVEFRLVTSVPWFDAKIIAAVS